MPSDCTVRRHSPFLPMALIALGACLVLPGAASAQPFGWGGYGPGYGPGWGPGWNDSPRLRSRTSDPREGQVDVSRFVVEGDAAQALGHGPVVVSSNSGNNDAGWVDPAQRAAYEAAIVDGLIDVGYDTLHAGGPEAQQVNLKITREVLSPAEEKRSPVSGSAAMSVGTYGSAYGLAVNVDLTKPRTALVSTRVDMRILDHEDGAVLWEGHAEIATREGADDWTDYRIAGKLAAALLDRFPEAQAVPAPVPADPVPADPAPAGPKPAAASDTP